MQIAECPHCGAPLPANDGTSRVVCEFCGTALEPTQQASPLVELIAEAEQRAATTHRVVITERAQITAPAKAAGCAGLAIFLSIFALAGGIIWFAVHTATSSLRQGMKLALPHLLVDNAPLKVAELGGARFTGREVPLDVSPPIGGYAAVDAAVNLPWALAIAQGWQRDVRLDRADVDRMRPDGTVNCRDDAEASVLYRFLSPGRIEEFRRQSDLTRNAEGEYEFWVTVKKGQTWARTLRSRSLPSDLDRFTNPVHARAERTAGRGFTVPAFPAVPPLRQVVATASRQSRWLAKPFYDAYLLFSPDEGWVWYVSGLSGHDSMPRIRASDGRMYPFSR